VNAAETAIAENADHIAARRLLFFKCATMASASCKYTAVLPNAWMSLSSFCGSSLSSGLSSSSRAICDTTTASALRNASASSVWKMLRRVVCWCGVRNGPDAVLRVFQTQRVQGSRGWQSMMPKIVQHRDPARHAPHFHAAFDAFEGVEGALDLFVGQPAMFGASYHCQRVAPRSIPRPC